MKRSKLGPGKRSLERGSTFRPARQKDDREPPPGPPPPPTPGVENIARPAPLLSDIDRQAWGTRRSRMGASKSQVAKRKRVGACIVTGDTEGIDAAHLVDRSLGGCDSPECVVPLRRDVHEAYDRHEFDLLPFLIAQGCVAELQHALGHMDGNVLGLLERLTGDRYVPERQAA